MEYQFLEPRPTSKYRQLFVRGRRIRAEVLYRATVGPDAEPPETVARDFHVPLEAVLESIDYATQNKDLLDAERVNEERNYQEFLQRRGNSESTPT